MMSPRRYSRALDGKRSPAFPLLWGLLAATFLLGGGARADILSLVLLRPLSVGFLFAGLLTLRKSHVRHCRHLFGLALLLVALAAAHLVPLPPDAWQALPGRDIVEDAARLAGLEAGWRPLTLDPAATRNALWALAGPIAVLVLGAQLEPADLRRLLHLVLFAGLGSGLLALLQILGDPQGPLYLYEVTNNGAAVGLFANRNHQAVFLAVLLPASAAWTRAVRIPPQAMLSDRAARRSLIAATWAFLIPLILITGSRAGLVLAAVGAAVTPLVFRMGRNAGATPARPEGGTRSWLVPVAMAGLAAITIWLGRALSLDRLFATDTGEEMRIAILPVMSDMISLYWPSGTGLGSYEAVYQVHEPDQLLGPAHMNHAHNDWLEVLLTAGLPGLALLVLAAVMFGVRVVGMIRRTNGDEPVLEMQRLGLFVLVLLAGASITDYPLRVPSLACLAVLAAVWSIAERNRVNRGD